MTIGSINLADSVISQAEYTEEENKTTRFQSLLEQAVLTEDEEELLDACKQVESYMLSTIMKQMKQSTTLGETLIPKGDYEEMFEGYLIDAQCEKLVDAGGIGLADMMYRQIIKAYSSESE